MREAHVMVTAEFDLPAGHIDIPPVVATELPRSGLPEAAVLAEIKSRFDRNRFTREKNFAISYSGTPAPITRKVEEIAVGEFFVEWADSESGTLSMEREAVGMMAHLLGKPLAPGFITTGGTESNLAAMRLARNNGRQSQPEFIVPVTIHFSFRLGAELLGIRLVEVEVDGRGLQPRIADVERAITPRTVGIACSAPAGSLGTMEPVEEFADLAWRKGLYCHVDAAFGGFILPFMRELGYDIPPFDLSLPGVSSISTDGHKLGLLPLSTGFFIARDAALFEAIPTERTLIHTTSSTKPGSRAAAAWATMRHLGWRGYLQSTEHVLTLRDTIIDGLTAIPGISLAAPKFISVVGFTSTTIDLENVHTLLEQGGWGHNYGELRGMPFIRLSIHPSRSTESAHGFICAFEAAVRAQR
jgi:tyrosine decarboxylase / aspartate 1-decarboxylase